jgi:phage-related minor tail protein
MTIPDHGGEYAPANHDHGQAELWRQIRELASDHVTRANVADMLEAFRLEYRSQLADIARRLGALEAVVLPPLPAGKNRLDALEGKLHLIDQAVDQAAADMIRLEAKLAALGSDVAALLERTDELEAEDMADRIEALEDALSLPRAADLDPDPPAADDDDEHQAAELEAELGRADEDRAAYDELGMRPW